MDLPTTNGVRLAPAPPKAMCESLIHDLDQRIPAVFTAHVTITPNLIANLDLCESCANELSDLVTR